MISTHSIQDRSSKDYTTIVRHINGSKAIIIRYCARLRRIYRQTRDIRILRYYIYNQPFIYLFQLGIKLTRSAVLISQDTVAVSYNKIASARVINKTRIIYD